MTRDMELIRKIIAEIQSWPDAKQRRLNLEGYDPNIVGRHVEMLKDAGYVNALIHHGAMKTEITAVITDLTWEGHDFAAAVANGTVWGRIKSALSPTELATMPLSIIKQLGMSLLQAYAMDKLKGG